MPVIVLFTEFSINLVEEYIYWRNLKYVVGNVLPSLWLSLNI